MKLKILGVMILTGGGLQAGTFTSLTPASIEVVFQANDGKAWDNLAMVERGLQIGRVRDLERKSLVDKKGELARLLRIDVGDFQQKSDGGAVSWNWERLARYVPKIVSKDLADEILWRLRIKYWQAQLRGLQATLDGARRLDQKNVNDQDAQKRHNADLQKQIDQVVTRQNQLHREFISLQARKIDLEGQIRGLQSRVRGSGNPELRLARQRLVTRDLDQKVAQFIPARQAEEIQALEQQIRDVQTALEARPYSLIDQIRQENSLVLNQNLAIPYDEGLVPSMLEKMAYFNRNQHEFDLSKLDRTKWSYWLSRVRALNTTQLKRLVNLDPNSELAKTLFNTIRLRIKDFDLNQTLDPKFNLYDAKTIEQLEEQLDLWRVVVASKGDVR